MSKAKSQTLPSGNKDGNTAKLAEKLLAGNRYETLNLVDYKLYSYGQQFEDDQFMEIVARMKGAEVIVIGSPVYWHSMSGAVRNLIDRFYGPVRAGELSGKKFVFLFQGAVPEKCFIPMKGFLMALALEPGLWLRDGSMDAAAFWEAQCE